MRSGLKRLLHKGFFHVFGSSALNQVVSFAYSLLIVRVISKEDFGVYSYAVNIYTMFILLSGFGLVSAVMQLGSEYADDEHRVSSLFAYSTRFGLLFNAGLCAAILLTGLLIPLPISGSNQILMTMALIPLLMILKDFGVIWLRVQLKQKQFSYANTLNALLKSGLTILGAMLLKSTGIVLGHYLVEIIMLVVLVSWLKVPVNLRGNSLARQDKRDLFQIAGISVLNNTLSQLLSLLGAFMLGLVVLDESIVASFKVATTIPFALNFIPSSLMIFVYPYFARNKNNREWVRQNYRKLMVYVGLGNLAIALGGILLARPIIGIAFGAQYLDAVPSFQILMASYFVSGTFRSISGNLLVTQRKLGSNLVAGVIGSVTTVLLNVWLIPRWGSIGASVSYAVTMLVTGAFSTVMMTAAIRQIPENHV